MSDILHADLVKKIKDELSSLAVYVDMAKDGLESLESAVKLTSEKFPEASGHLSTITGDLENAANSIMSIVEALMLEQDRAKALLDELGGFIKGVSGPDSSKAESAFSELKNINGKTRADMMEIFSSLSFHDLSGQKLKKVVSALSAVEKKILELANSFGFIDGSRDAASRKSAETEKYSQSAVDEILKGMGKRGAK